MGEQREGGQLAPHQEAAADRLRNREHKKPHLWQLLFQMANAMLHLRPLRLDAVAVDQESSNDFFLRDGETFKCVACP